jgi:hypothetical protein
MMAKAQVVALVIAALMLLQMRLADHQDCSLRQAFENREITFVEGERMRRADFHQPDDIALVADGRGRQRANAVLATNLCVDPRVGLGVIATQSLAGPDALAGKSGLEIDASAERRAPNSDARAA